MKNPLVIFGHKVLKNDLIYDLYQNLVGGVKYRERFVKSIVSKNRKIFNYIDIGCGTGEIMKVLNFRHNYLGIDLSEKYLSKAKNRGKTRLNFQVLNYDLTKQGWSKITTNIFEDNEPINIIALGLLHHMDDESIKTLLNEVHKIIKSKGSFFSVDPVITQESTNIAKWFARNDRGEFVRTQEELAILFKNIGFTTNIQIKKNQFRIPLDTIEIEAKPF